MLFLRQGRQIFFICGLYLLTACGPHFAASSNALSEVSQGFPDQPVSPTPKPSATPLSVATPVPAAIASNAANRVVCAGLQTTPGLDVSDYDSGTQWSVVQHGGAGFTFIKATEGTDFTNNLFKADWVNSKNAGLIRGAYHFFHPGDDPVVQAQFYVQTLGALAADDLAPMLDWEVSDGVSASVQIQNAKTWLALVEAATGKTPVIYVGPSYWNSLGNPQGFQRYPLFIAEYGVSCPQVPPPWSNWTFWQMGTVPIAGVKTSTADQDVFNGSLTQLTAFVTNSGLVAPVVP